MEWGILVQRAMNARFIIVRGISTQDPAQVRLPKYDHVVETRRLRQLRRLRARRERPRSHGGRAAEKRDEFAPWAPLCPRIAPYHIVVGRNVMLCASQQNWPYGPKATSALSPFDSQLRTLIGAARRSHSCQDLPWSSSVFLRK